MVSKKRGGKIIKTDISREGNTKRRKPRKTKK